MTILIGLIEKVVAKELKSNILFLFQPAEEGLGGAKKILKSGIFDCYNIKEAYALHVNGKLPLGLVSSKPGIFFANTEEFNIYFKGESSHTANPEKGKDAIQAALSFYQMMNNHIIKSFSPKDSVIFHTGKIEGGNVRNAIADKCFLKGTMRSLSDDNHEKLKRLISKVKKAIEETYEVKIELEYPNFYRHVSNDELLFKKLKAVCKKFDYDFKQADTAMTGEDFGYLAQKFSGLLFWLGTSEKNNYDLHSSKFLPSEKAISFGLEIMFLMANSK